MYKRRDWVFTRNPDASGSEESDDESEDGSDGDAAGLRGQAPSTKRKRAPAPPGDGDVSTADGDSGDEDQDDDGGSEEDGELAALGDMDMETLQALLEQEDDDDDDGGAPKSRKRRAPFADREALEELRADWLLGGEGDCAKGAVRCLLCPGSLLLNAETFRAHLTSKKHLVKAKAAGLDEEAQLDSIVWAEAISSDDYGAETHAERSARLAKQGAGRGELEQGAEEGGAKAGKKAPRKRGGKQWQERQAKLKERAKKGKPGRRQRQLLKAAKGDAVTGDQAEKCSSSAQAGKRTEADRVKGGVGKKAVSRSTAVR